ncbi:cytochrome P450 [Exidia glandulosa HHB12029]|uniref:Cytochrome P450 n=1 Tax=Exidia glandulosa HHB12029 TaxID=1314781 RepID=A0A165J5N8_EXIGL|nr:cytochrome P450 [Exidia glandulosa HHB12029]
MASRSSYPVHLSAALLLTLSWTALSAIVLVLYLGSKVARAVYNAFFSPLASIPGPPVAAVSNIWFEWNALRLRRTMAVHEAFERYGPLVRIGPNKLAVANAEEVREIYRSHKFRKSAWYDAIRFGGIHNSISTSEPEFHSMLRRWSAPAFRGDNLRAVSDALREEMQQFVDRIERESARGEAIDMLHLFKLLSLDILGIAVLGTQFDQMKTGQHHPLAHYIRKLCIGTMAVWGGTRRSNLRIYTPLCMAVTNRL